MNLEYEGIDHITSSTANWYIQIDPHKFAQVVRNLISNALKFTPAHGTVTVQLELLNIPVVKPRNTSILRRRSAIAVNYCTDPAELQYTHIKLIVHDTGAGISVVSLITRLLYSINQFTRLCYIFTLLIGYFFII